MAAQTKFAECSHAASTLAYQTIVSMAAPSPRTVAATLCKTLATIGTVCVKDLAQCFADDDLKQMKISHIDEMKKYLSGLSDLVTESSLDKCLATKEAATAASTDEAAAGDTTSVEPEAEATTATAAGSSTNAVQKGSRSVATGEAADYDYSEEYLDYSRVMDRLHGAEATAAAGAAVNHEADVFLDLGSEEARPGSGEAGGRSTEAAERLQHVSSSSRGIHSVYSVILFVSTLLCYATIL